MQISPVRVTFRKVFILNIIKIGQPGSRNINRKRKIREAK